MNAHLLSLATLHAAAPGVLEVVFGPDGDFEGAPLWHPALYMLVGRRFVDDWQRTDDVIWLDLPPHGLVAHGQVALDLRVPSVAARLAGLCAKAVTAEPGFVIGACVGQHRSGLWQLLWRDEHGHGKDACWRDDGKRCHPFDPDLIGAPFESSEHFLASLFLSLAPRIAALRKP